MSLLATLCCLAASSFVVAYWLEHRVLNTDAWVATVAPLPKEPMVSTALGTYIGDQIFTAVPVEAKISDALPPKAAFLASPLAEQLQSLTAQASQKLVASDGFQTVWISANQLAMDRLLAAARGQPGPIESRLNERFNLDLRDSAAQLRSALGNTAAALPSLDTSVRTDVMLSTDLNVERSRLRQFVRATDMLAAVLPLVILASFLSLLAITGHRRQTSIAVVLGVITLLLIELILVKWLRQETLDQVRNPDNLAAIGYIYDTLTAGLKRVITVCLGALFFVLGIFMLSGPSQWARRLRSYVGLDRLNASQPVKRLHGIRQWVRSREHRLWLLVLILILITLALLAHITTYTIINALLLFISFVSFIHIVATPRETPISPVKQ